VTMKHAYPEVADETPVVTWTAVDSGLWVAKSGGEFAGLAERRWGSCFSVTDGIGRPVGEYPTLREAQESLVHRVEAGPPA